MNGRTIAYSLFPLLSILRHSLIGVRRSIFKRAGSGVTYNRTRPEPLPGIDRNLRNSVTYAQTFTLYLE